MSLGSPTLPVPTCSTLGRPRHLDAVLARVCGVARDGRANSGTASKGGRGAPPKVEDTAESAPPRHHSIARRAGFTLIEVMVVIVVIGLLVGLVAPTIIERLSDAKSGTAKAQLALLGSALDTYRLDTGAYPTTAQGLEALRTAPTRAPVPLAWRGPYLRKDVPADPWGRPYLYKSPGDRNASGFDLWSLGRDGKEGGKGEDADLIGN